MITASQTHQLECKNKNIIQKTQEMLFYLKNMVHSKAFLFSLSSCPKRIMGLILHLAIHNSLIYFSFQTTFYDFAYNPKGEVPNTWCDFVRTIWIMQSINFTTLTATTKRKNSIYWFKPGALILKISNRIVSDKCSTLKSTVQYYLYSSSNLWWTFISVS